MGKTPSLNLLKPLKVPKDRVRFMSLKEGEDDHQQPLSPGARLYHQPGFNVYIVFIMGMKTPIDIDVLKANALHLIDMNHCFSTLQVEDKANGSMTRVPTHVNIDDHLIVPEVNLNMQSLDKFIEDYITDLTTTCIDNSKPLWDLHILNTRTLDAQGTCIFRIHHSLGDGMSLINLLLSCSRKVSDPEALPTFPVTKKSHHHSKDTTLSSLVMVLWNTFVAFVMFVFTILFFKDTETPLKGSIGVENRRRRIVTRSVSLGDIKLVKNAMDATVNDVITGVIQAGFFRYLNRRYETNTPVPKNIRLRGMVIYNLRDSTIVDASTNTNKHGTWGNKIGYVLLPFIMKHRRDPLESVREAKAIMECKKASFEPFINKLIARSFVQKLFGNKIAGKLNRRVYSNTTFAFSNVPGPKEEICFLGHEVAYIAPSGYGVPNALVIHVISYVDKMTFVISVDEETIPDPQTLCDDLQESLNLIKCSVLAKDCVKN